MLLGGSVSPWRSGVEEGRSPLGRFRTPEPCFPRTYATWDAKKDENRFGSMKFRISSANPTQAFSFTAASNATFVVNIISSLAGGGGPLLNKRIVGGVWAAGRHLSITGR